MPWFFLCSSDSPRSPVVHSYTVSEVSHPESDMPLPEIVTGSILQGLHDEISMKLAEELGLDDNMRSSEDTTYPEFQTRDLQTNDCLQQNSLHTEGTMRFGVQWVRLTPDEDMVSNIHGCLAKVAELAINNWQWIPLVALPIVLIAINHWEYGFEEIREVLKGLHEYVGAAQSIPFGHCNVVALSFFSNFLIVDVFHWSNCGWIKLIWSQGGYCVGLIFRPAVIDALGNYETVWGQTTCASVVVLLYNLNRNHGS